MSAITYEIVEHDGGWAYRLGDVYSEPFASRREAETAAKEAAAEHRAPGSTEVIEYEDEQGEWHTELAPGRDRPDVRVETGTSNEED